MATTSLDPAADAERVLAEYWPSRIMPVDPVAIARKMGVEVKQAELPENVSAALLKKPGSDAVIVLARGDSDRRKRFSCAHELGHYVHRAAEQCIEYIDLRGTLAAQGIDEDEKFANAFAACLLMPERELRAHCDAYRAKHGTSVPVWLVAAHFAVSGDAMGFRLQNLGIRHERG